MSAIVRILNKSAVAVAADSALTHICNNGKKKVWNTTRKVFQLIPGQSVGVSTCGHADFMEVPMELIIGLYGKQNEGKSFGFAWGISPAMIRTVHKLLKCALTAYHNAVLDCLDESKVYCSLLDELNIHDYCKEAMDLVSLAELSSRTSGDTESVQGPIDVAVITKVDGFVWKKRK